MGQPCLQSWEALDSDLYLTATAFFPCQKSYIILSEIYHLPDPFFPLSNKIKNRRSASSEAPSQNWNVTLQQ